jgi:DNA polymerase-1
MAFNFSKVLEKDEGSVLIVDSLNLAFRWKHQGRTDFCDEYVKTVISLAHSYRCENIIITSDLGTSTYRKAISDDYKQSRKDKYAEQTDEEKKAFEDFFIEYERTLVELSKVYPVFRFKGVEADDIAAYLVKYRDKFKFGEIWLISSDRDWDLLIQEGVSRFSYVTRKEVTIENWESHYEVTPEEYISFKCLVGDKGDNVEGITGIGPKRAATLITAYGSAMDIYDQLPIDSKYKFIQELNANGERLLTNYQLMDLITYCEDAIGADNTAKIDRRLIDGNFLQQG